MTAGTARVSNLTPPGSECDPIGRGSLAAATAAAAAAAARLSAKKTAADVCAAAGGPQSGARTVRENEAVTVDPVRVLGVVVHELAPQEVRKFCVAPWT